MVNEGERSKLDQLCSRIIEAGWLASAIVAPVFFNIHSVCIFEPDKHSLVRSIAVVMATAWLIGLVERKGRGIPLSRMSLRDPVALSVLSLVAVTILATLTSISPGVSFFGSCKRMGGAYSTLGFIVIFALILLEMRTREQTRRLVMTIIPASVPVCLHAILQKTGMEPLAWDGDAILGTPSAMGNPIFLAAYRPMVSLLTWGKLAVEFIEMRRHARKIPVILHGLIALVQYGHSLSPISKVAKTATTFRAPQIQTVIGFPMLGLITVLREKCRSRLKSQARRNLIPPISWFNRKESA